MRVLELHTGVDWVGRTLASMGHEVVRLVPEPRVEVFRSQDPATPVFGIDRWADREALAALAEVLPPYDAVATIDEQAVLAAAVLRELRGVPGLGVEDATAFTDKHAMKARLAAAGIPVTPHRVVSRAEEVEAVFDELGEDVVVKPRVGAAANKTARVRGRAALESLIASGFFDRRQDDPSGRFSAGQLLDSLHEAPDGFVVEKFVPGEEYFCDVYRHEGETLLSVPGRYDAPLLSSLGSHAWDTLLPAGHPDAEAVNALTTRALHALNLRDGAAHCELFKTADGTWVFGEAGARVGGGGIYLMVGRQYGFDPQHAVCALAVGERPEFAPAPRHPVLTTLMLVVEPGLVTHVAPEDRIRAAADVVELDIHLKAGEPAPQSLGTFLSAGRILFATESLEDVDPTVEKLLTALEVRIEAL